MPAYEKPFTPCKSQLRQAKTARVPVKFNFFPHVNCQIRCNHALSAPTLALRCAVKNPPATPPRLSSHTANLRQASLAHSPTYPSSHPPQNPSIPPTPIHFVIHCVNRSEWVERPKIQQKKREANRKTCKRRTSEAPRVGSVHYTDIASTHTHTQVPSRQ